MTKTKLLIIGLIILAAITVFLAIFSQHSSPTPQESVITPTPVAPPATSRTASSSGNLSSPNQQTTPVGNTLTTSDFLKTAKPFDPQGDVVVTDSSGYRIIYFPKTKRFLITITGHGFDANRLAAEQALLQQLGISQEDACKLQITVTTTSSANPDQAGQEYPLSFCGQSSQANPSATPAIYRTSQSLAIDVGNPPVGGGAFVKVAQAITGKLSKSGGALFDQFTGHPRGIPATMTLPPEIQQLYPSYKVVLRGGSNIGPAWRYWCTDLIIDTYNLSFGKKVLGEDLGNVQSQVVFWKTHGQGFAYDHYVLNHQNSLQTLFSSAQFGEPIFWQTTEGSYTDGGHVGLISGGTLDSHGNGEIDTYEANSWTTTGKYPIVNWQVKNVPYPVVGFGLYTGK